MTIELPEQPVTEKSDTRRVRLPLRHPPGGPLLVAFYGSLKRGFPAHRRFRLHKRLRYLGPCLLRGRLHDLGCYPGLVEGPGLVRGELFEVLDQTLITDLDRFEGYDPSHPAHSHYLRKQVQLFEPTGHAWTYVYNRPVLGRPWLRAGSWPK